MKKWYDNIRQFLSSSRGRDVLLYLLFVAISAAFWAILTLGNSIQTHYKVKFTIDDIPEGTTMITDGPKYLDVSVKNKGYAFVRYMVGAVPEVQAKFSTYADGKGNFVITKQNMDELLRDAFGKDASLETFSPEQLSLKYTTLPGKKVAIRVNGDITADMQYVVNGAVVVSPARVTVFGGADQLNEIESVVTERIVRHNLKERTSVKVALVKRPDVKFVPDSIVVSIPVEPLVNKDLETTISIVNCPKGEHLVVFPATVKVSYLLPLSSYNKNVGNHPTVYVDYNDIKSSAKKLPVHIGKSDICHNISLPIDSVEYIIE